MARQYSDAVRDAKRQAHETTIGTAPKLRILTGAMPANCAAAQTGTLLVEIDLPSDWLSHNGSGVSTKLGTWSATSAAGGTAGYYRIVDTAGTTCHEQGTAGTVGTEDMVLDGNPTAAGQTVTVTTYTITEGNS